MILKFYSNNIIINVSSAEIEEYINHRGTFKRIKLNGSVYAKKNDYIEFECSECHKIKKQQIRQNRTHLFSVNPICGECTYTKNIIEKYGVDNVWKAKSVQENIKKTNVERYGCENVLQNEDMKQRVRDTQFSKNNGVYAFNTEKQKQTMKERYGNEVPWKSKIIIEKIEQTNLERYGVKNVFDSLEIREKIKQTCLERYGNEIFMKSDRYREKIKELEKEPYSLAEKEVVEYIQSLGIENIIENTYSIISPLELDIYLPDYNVAIEYDGLYWHSDLYKEPDFHIRKTEMCEFKGIRLIHVFENEWVNNREWVQSQIKQVLKLESVEVPEDVVADKRYPIDYKELGYEVVEHIDPKCWYIDLNRTLSLHPIEDASVIYDCGSIRYKKIKDKGSWQ